MKKTKEELIREILTKHGYASQWQGKELIASAFEIYNLACDDCAESALADADDGGYNGFVDEQSILKNKFEV